MSLYFMLINYFKEVQQACNTTFFIQKMFCFLLYFGFKIVWMVRKLNNKSNFLSRTILLKLHGTLKKKIEKAKGRDGARCAKQQYMRLT